MLRSATALVLFLPFALAAPAADAQAWSPQTSGTSAELTGVHFLSATTGFAVGEGGVLLSTADGGQNWIARTLPAEDLEGLAFNPSGTVGIAASDDGPVFRTIDGGLTWQAVSTGAGDLRDVSWASDTVVWVAGREADAAVSTDAGQTWTYRSTGSSDRTEGVAAVSAAEAWVVNRGGEIRHTANGGQTWTSQPSGTGEDLSDIQMLDAQTGYVAGGDGVLRTVNGGQTWTNVSGDDVEGEGLFFFDVTTGWVVGEDGDIGFTSDGGQTWTRQSSGTSAALTAVHFPTRDDGWAVGEGGVIVKFSGVPTASEPKAVPGGFALSEVSPNPFASSARLTLDVAKAERVTAAVYDALGRRVAVLHDGVLAAGAHAFVLDGSALPDGLYLVRVSGETFRATRRLTHTR